MSEITERKEWSKLVYRYKNNHSCGVPPTWPSGFFIHSILWTQFSFAIYRLCLYIFKFPIRNIEIVSRYVCSTRKRLTYEMIGRLKTLAMRASWMHVSCGPMYVLMLRRVNSTVRCMLYDSLPYVSAITNSTLWSGNTCRHTHHTFNAQRCLARQIN